MVKIDDSNKKFQKECLNVYESVTDIVYEAMEEHEKLPVFTNLDKKPGFPCYMRFFDEQRKTKLGTDPALLIGQDWNKSELEFNVYDSRYVGFALDIATKVEEKLDLETVIHRYDR